MRIISEEEYATLREAGLAEGLGIQGNFVVAWDTDALEFVRVNVAGGP